jgi:hypothetical protein
MRIKVVDSLYPLAGRTCEVISDVLELLPGTIAMKSILPCERIDYSAICSCHFGTTNFQGR